jgi:hypothetical protein
MPFAWSPCPIIATWRKLVSPLQDEDDDVDDVEEQAGGVAQSTPSPNSLQAVSDISLPATKTPEVRADPVTRRCACRLFTPSWTCFGLSRAVVTGPVCLVFPPPVRCQSPLLLHDSQAWLLHDSVLTCLGFFPVPLRGQECQGPEVRLSLTVHVTVQLPTEGDPSSGSQEAKKFHGQLEVGRSHALVDVDPADCYAVDNPRACAVQRVRVRVGSVIMCVPKVLWTLAQKVARRGHRRDKCARPVLKSRGSEHGR